MSLQTKAVIITRGHRPLYHSSRPTFMWKDLSMSEKAEVIRIGVKCGMRSLNDIRRAYNIHANGGYLKWKEAIASHKGINIDEDNTYDYESYYNKYPEMAWGMLGEDPEAHFTDEFKTIYHPTFSTGSIYSGVKHPIHNPDGLVGGTWSEDGHTYTMHPDGYRAPVSMDDRLNYLTEAEDNGVVLREADGSLPIFDGIMFGGVLPAVTVIGSRRRNE